MGGGEKLPPPQYKVSKNSLITNRARALDWQILKNSSNVFWPKAASRIFLEIESKSTNVTRFVKQQRVAPYIDEKKGKILYHTFIMSNVNYVLLSGTMGTRA